MSSRVQLVLLVAGLSCYVLNVVLVVRKYFKGSGISPGSLGASIPLLVVLFAQGWPMWLRVALAPPVVLLEFSWIGTYWVLGRLFPGRVAPS